MVRLEEKYYGGKVEIRGLEDLRAHAGELILIGLSNSNQGKTVDCVSGFY